MFAVATESLSAQSFSVPRPSPEIFSLPLSLGGLDQNTRIESLLHHNLLQSGSLADDLQQNFTFGSASGSESAMQVPPAVSAALAALAAARPSASASTSTSTSGSGCDFGFLIEFGANGLRRHQLSSKVAVIRIGAHEFDCEIKFQQRKRKAKEKAKVNVEKECEKYSQSKDEITCDDYDDNKEEKKEKAKETQTEDEKVKDKDKAKLKQKPKEEAQHSNSNSNSNNHGHIHGHGLDDEQPKKQKEHKHEEKDKSERKHNDKDDDKHDKTETKTNTENENENENEMKNDNEEDGVRSVVSELVLTSFGEDRWASAKSELLYQNKLLSQLRSALANSQSELISVCENDATADLSRLGAMALEQQRLNAEIKKVESQTVIKYTAVQRIKSYRLKPSQVCTIEDVCVMWSPPLFPFRSEQTKERSALSVSINSNGKELQFVNLPMDHPLKKITPKFYWDRSTHRGANFALSDSIGVIFTGFSNPFLNSTDNTKAIHSGANASQGCVSALPALSTTQISQWNLRVTRGTSFASTGNTANQHWMGFGIQNKAMPSGAQSSSEHGTLLFGCPANGGVYQPSQVYTQIKSASFFSRSLQHNDVLHFILDPVALKLTVSLNAEKDEAIFQLPSAGPYWIHANMYYNGDGVEFVPNE